MGTNTKQPNQTPKRNTFLTIDKYCFLLLCFLFFCAVMLDMNSRLNSQRRSLFHELPYFGQNITLAHGQFNNCLSCHLPSDPLHYITWHRIASHRIASHRIALHRIALDYNKIRLHYVTIKYDIYMHLKYEVSAIQ